MLKRGCSIYKQLSYGTSEKRIQPNMSSVVFLFCPEPPRTELRTKREALAEKVVSDTKLLLDCDTLFDSSCIVLERFVYIVHVLNYSAHIIHRLGDIGLTKQELYYLKFNETEIWMIIALVRRLNKLKRFTCRMVAVGANASSY